MKPADQQLQEAKKTWGNSRVAGKSLKAYIDFFENGKKGKAIIYATPNGNFLSPKAAENLVKFTEQKVRREWVI